jgi:hypothetical protein
VIYDKECKSCHGTSGLANPAIAKMIKVEMKDLSSAENQAGSDDDIKRIITEGKGKMKACRGRNGRRCRDRVRSQLEKIALP